MEGPQENQVPISNLAWIYNGSSEEGSAGLLPSVVAFAKVNGREPVMIV